MPRENDKRLIKDAIQEVFSERVVTYANGAVQFANAITESWAGVINAVDGFFLRNFVDDQPPEAVEPILKARLAAARRARDLIVDKVDQLEKQVKSHPAGEGRRAAARKTTRRSARKGSRKTG
jgi:hypothetical protein